MPLTPVEVAGPKYLPEVGEYVAAYEMTADEFLEWEHEGFAEWVDGRAYQYMSVNPGHQTVVQFLVTLLSSLAAVRIGGRILSGPAAMRPSAGGRIREPDLVYVTDEHAGRITDRLLEGPADIVIEVVSRDSVARDRIAKLEEYKLARIPEYWIIDARPGIHRAEFLVLSTDPLTGAPEYESHSFDEFGVFRSVVAPALWVRRAWLFSDQPDLASALREVVGLTLSE